MSSQVSGPQRRRRTVRFYRTASGSEVVREELRKLDRESRAAVSAGLRALEKGTTLPRQTEKVDADVWALRVTFDGCEFRMLYATVSDNKRVLLALRLIEKKDRKLRKNDLKRARARLADWKKRGEAR